MAEELIRHGQRERAAEKTMQMRSPYGTVTSRSVHEQSADDQRRRHNRGQQHPAAPQPRALPHTQHPCPGRTQLLPQPLSPATGLLAAKKDCGTNNEVCPARRLTNVWYMPGHFSIGNMEARLDCVKLLFPWSQRLLLLVSSLSSIVIAFIIFITVFGVAYSLRRA